VRKRNFHLEDLPANLPDEKKDSMKTCGFHAFDQQRYIWLLATKM
jgi:hypothetical protein